MPKQTIFIRGHALPAAVEVEIAEAALMGDLLALITKAGIAVDNETAIFIDEAEMPHDLTPAAPVAGIKHGSHVHVTKCKKIDVTVNYLDGTATHKFAPGARVRRVKAWAVDKFNLTPHDAAEHVLQMCGTTRRPASDTPLNELTDGKTCAICFDLVPEKRVEG
jgi:hypothetical protein